MLAILNMAHVLSLRSGLVIACLQNDMSIRRTGCRTRDGLMAVIVQNESSGHDARCKF